MQKYLLSLAGLVIVATFMSVPFGVASEISTTLVQEGTQEPKKIAEKKAETKPGFVLEGTGPLRIAFQRTFDEPIEDAVVQKDETGAYWVQAVDFGDRLEWFDRTGKITKTVKRKYKWEQLVLRPDGKAYVFYSPNIQYWEHVSEEEIQANRRFLYVIDSDTGKTLFSFNGVFGGAQYTQYEPFQLIISGGDEDDELRQKDNNATLLVVNSDGKVTDIGGNPHEILDLPTGGFAARLPSEVIVYQPQDTNPIWRRKTQPPSKFSRPVIGGDSNIYITEKKGDGNSSISLLKEENLQTVGTFNKAYSLSSMRSPNTIYLSPRLAGYHDITLLQISGESKKYSTISPPIGVAGGVSTLPFWGNLAAFHAKSNTYAVLFLDEHSQICNILSYLGVRLQIRKLGEGIVLQTNAGIAVVKIGEK